MLWGCIGSLDMLAYKVMRSSTSLQEMALFYSLSDHSRPWGSLDRIYEEGLDRWLVNQHWVWWWGFGDTQRLAQELIWGPCLGAKARFLSFNRMQSRADTGLTGHNTLTRHLHLKRLSDSPLCKRCGAKVDTSAHILCECEALASLRHVYLGSYLEPEDINSKVWGPSGTLAK